MSDISRYGRHICPVCDRSMALTKMGRMRRHGSKNDTWPPEDCAGTGQEPKENPPSDQQAPEA